MFKKKSVSESRRPTTGAQAKIYSRDNVSRYSERARQRRRGKKVRRVALIVVLGVLLGGVSAAGLWFSSVMGKINDSNVITSGLKNILQDTDEAKDPFYVLLLGTDGRPGEEQYRADSIILARIDPTKKQATLISIPRDTKVVYKGETMKINACHTNDGAEGMVEAVNELCGIKINHYAEVSFDGMQQLIDAVGGIDINATDDVDDPEHLDIKISAGQQHMDGATALTYARCRYTYTDGDYTRMRHQRQVLGALANQILNNFDATKIVGLVNSLSDMLTTDMSVEDIVSTVNAMRGMDVDGIYSANLPSYADASTTIDGVSYVFVYEDDLKAMMKRVEAGEDPKGPQTMGEGDGSGSTIGDLSKSTSDDWASGAASGSSDETSDDSSDSSSDQSDGTYSSDSSGYDSGYDNSGYGNSGYGNGY